MVTYLLIGFAIVFCLLAYRYLQRGAHLVGGVIDAPAPVRAAAKRTGFNAHTNVHSIVSIHTAELCVTAMALAFAQMDNNAPPDETMLARSLQKHLQCDRQVIEDYCTLAPWLVDQGDGPTPAFAHLTKRLKQLDHGPFFEKMMQVLGDVTASGTKGMPSAAQADAMGALARIFRTA